MTQVRTKKVTRDGAEFIIAPLNLDQIEQYVKLEDLANRKNVGFTKAFEVVCYGLNNALPEDTPEEQKWTPAKVKKNVDLVMFELLQQEIIDFSGFKLDKEAIDAAGRAAIGVPGESSAAPEEDSSQSTEVIGLQKSSSVPSVVA
jgi:hypothetical protein